MTAELLSDLHDTSDAYLQAMITNSTDRALELRDTPKALAFEASAALLASLSLLSKALKMRPQGQPENDLRRLVWAAVDLTLDQPGAADTLLPQLERLT